MPIIQSSPLDSNIFLSNTMILVAGNVTGAVLTSALCGYSFSRLRWPGRDFFFGLLMTGMMLPYAVNRRVWDQGLRISIV